MDDKMPIWLLLDNTDEELLNLYSAMPFVRNDMTYEEFKEEWLRQREEYYHSKV